MSIDGGLRALFRKHLPHFFITTIETGGTGRGIPDLEYCSPAGVSGWVECKKTGAWAVDLEPEQVAWLTRRARYKGRCFIAVRRKHAGGPRKGPPIDEIYIWPGARAADLKRLGLEHGLLGDCYGANGPARWSWDAIARLLTT
jgi:hypothetical protein